MFSSWRPPLFAAAALALVLPGGAALALDQPSLEEMEALLRDLGFDPGPVDGVVDEVTIEAIRQYHDFALRPGAPEPNQSLLDELRGVAAAFAALNADKRQQVSADAAPEPLPDLGAGDPATEVPQAEATPVPEGAPEPAPEPAQEPEVAALPEKVVVPPPPAPPKLIVEEPAAEPEAPAEPEAQVAELPPPAATPPVTEPAPPSAAEVAEIAPLDPAALEQLRIDEELAPYRGRLNDGSLTRAELSRQFNTEGRKLLQQAQYDDAILKFTVAIHLDPTFAGAYSNRGTAYQHNEAADLAQQDFDKAKTLGFGGFRVKDGREPLN
jgi:tetratricopeptide (TPR) repeat protein